MILKSSSKRSYLVYYLAIVVCVCFAKITYGQTDTAHSSFTFLNAANFDVTGIGKTNYLGHINVTQYPTKVYGIGYNAGMMKISYNPDSSSKILAFRNITIDPLKPVVVGSQFYKQASYLSTIVTNTAYSLYIQPYLQLYESGGNKILFHLHGELLIFNTTATTKYSDMQKEINTYTAQDSINRVLVYKGNANDTNATVYHRSLLNGYFGAGMTFVLKPGTGTFFFQGTLGVTTNYPNFESYLGTPNTPINKYNSFYLIRSSYAAKLTNNSTLILGTDIRGLFPRYKPLYAIYIGLNLSVDALGKLLDGTH
ncbi:MAG: hypothetical protein ACXVB0_10550 [Mucilaginibacter sp.]